MMMAAAGLSIGLMMMPVATMPAKADINISIGLDGKNRISCRRGARIVENAGFWDVRARNCSGDHYKYLGRRQGNKRFVITVNSRRGRIVDVDRIR
jgi:hypothetical protein